MMVIDGFIKRTEDGDDFKWTQAEKRVDTRRLSIG